MLRNKKQTLFRIDDDPLWYKDAIIYELHVRAFCDSNGDGIGDFRGLMQKLDYLQDLGVTAIWLLPFNRSPLKDDGYDIADYTDLNPSYGTRRDFKTFVDEAHSRGLRVITELVVNHTSDQHEWFQRARHAPAGSKWRNFYVWSDTPEKYADTRIIFKDTEPSNWSWDPVAKAYFWHRFFSHQPDLNYDNPEVQQAVFKVLEFWLKIGVDGLRLDAVPYLYEREGTNCENLPETHAFLKKLRQRIDKQFANRMFLAEANQWPEDATAYFGNGDECHMNFHFPLMPRMFMAIKMEDRFPIIDILQQTPSIPENCQWGLFLRNHDELTLEMVTDEERDYMYRVFARERQARINLGIRRRLAPLLGNDRAKIELMYSLLFSLPGTPVLYYGEEIGMGDNFYLGDRNGVRTPMQWSPDRNAGFSRANPHKLYLPVIIDPEYHYEAVNVELQEGNPQSLLWWMKRMLSLRKRSKVFGRGSIEFLHPSNRKVLAFIRRFRDERVLIVANLSRFAQWVELDLSAFNGYVPLDLFGRMKFPPIGDRFYQVTLGPHTFYWFALEPQEVAEVATRKPAEVTLPALAVTESWHNLLRGRNKSALERVLPQYLLGRRWFGGKARTIQSVEIVEVVPIPKDSPLAQLALIQVEYTDGEPEVYRLPIAFVPTEQTAQMQDVSGAIARLTVQGEAQAEEGVLYDAMSIKPLLKALMGVVSRGGRYAGAFGEVTATPTPAFKQLLKSAEDFLEPSVMKAEQSNTSVVYGDLFILKLYRRAEEGINPDLEIGRFLTKQEFPCIAPVASALEHRADGGEPSTVVLLQSFLPNEGDAWSYTLDSLGQYFSQALSRREDIAAEPPPTKSLLELAKGQFPTLAQELIGHYLDEVDLLGRRTGELHLALAQDSKDPNFSPEPFTDFYRRGLFQSISGLINRNFTLLRRRLKAVPEALHAPANRVLELEAKVKKRIQLMRDDKFTCHRIRCHGDYHLGQVLYTGKDFIIIDFEGEPARPLSVRRMKGSPIRDVAGMLRSFHYAAYAGLMGQAAGVRPEDFEQLEPAAKFWYIWSVATYLRAYLEVTDKALFLPKSKQELQTLLDIFLLEKAAYELGYELNNRPTWVRIPLEGILQLL
ncbi:MAG: maltose alpha-D-glucosyltransferase [Rhodoplanes sp.]